MNKSQFCKDARPGPLNGLLIVSCERLLAGPYCTKLLWELGATVVKVEPPEGEIARFLPPYSNNRSAYFAHVNYGKKSIALDLTDDADKDVLRRLVGQADIFFENMQPRYLDGLGFGEAALKRLNGQLIWASLTGFGSDADENRVAHDVVIQAMSGLMSVTGFEDAEPVRVGVEIGDLTGATYMAAAILGAVLDRMKNSGEGLSIDISLLDSLTAITEGTLLNYSVSKVVPKPKGNKEPAASPFDLYQCQDKKIAIVCANQTLYEIFCKAIGSDDMLADPRFLDNPSRVENADDLKKEINKVLAKRPAAEVVDLLTKAGVPVSQVNHVSDLFEHPQVLARNMIVAIEPSDGDSTIYTAGNPIKLSDYPDGPATRPAAPSLDADKETVAALLNT